nr:MULTISPECIES: hypothetical protein [unclassified Streptomyces]
MTFALPGRVKVTAGAVPLADMSNAPEAGMEVRGIVMGTDRRLSSCGADTSAVPSTEPSRVLAPTSGASPVKLASTVATPFTAALGLESPASSEPGRSVLTLIVTGTVPMPLNAQV